MNIAEYMRSSLARFRGDVSWEEWIIILVTAFVVITDVYLALNDREGDTYSEIFNVWAYQFAVLPAFWGVLSGHWFFTFGVPRPPNGLAYLLVIGAVLFLFDALGHSIIARSTHPAIWFTFGTALGSYFWAQVPQPL